MTKKILGLILVLLIGGAAGYHLGYYYGHREERAQVDEHADLWGTGDYRISAATAALAGTWKSKDDTRFTRQFSADGSVADKYAGDASATMTGTWKVLTEKEPEAGFPGPMKEGATYLKIAMGENNMHFELIKVTPEELELIYLDRGGALAFTKVQ